MIIPNNQKQYWKEKVILSWISIILQLATIILVLWRD
jgi:hypothetical protein